jgi:hypothetical protein
MKRNKIVIGLVLTIMLMSIGTYIFNSNIREKQQDTNSNPAIALQKSNWEAIEQVIGKTGEIKPGNVFRISLPRTDLQVTLDGVQLKPSFALGSWLAFKQTNKDAMVMGDLVLKEEEVNPVMRQLMAGGIKVTALHNHLKGESPSIMYMHIEGHGDPVKLAKVLRSGIDQSNTPIENPSNQSTQSFSLNKEVLDDILGKEGNISNGIYKMSFPRAEEIKENGMTIPPSMGTSTAINFQPTNGGNAAITGDFVLIAEEVNPVIKTLQENNIEVEAVHNHMLFEKPRLFFVHFWANDNAEKLAEGLRAAVDKTNVKK